MTTLVKTVESEGVVFKELGNYINKHAEILFKIRKKGIVVNFP